MENHAPAQQELERLVSQVVREVNRRLDGAKAADGSRNAGQEPMDLSRGKLLLSGCLSGEDERALSSFYQIEREIESADWDVLLFSRLSMETMAYAANGISGNPEASCILRGLLSGKKVFALEQGLEYRGFRDSAGKNLYRLYLLQEDQLKNIGVEVIPYAADVMRLSMDHGINMDRQSYPYSASTARPADLAHLRLLRESDVMRARNAGGQSLLLGQDTKITPLAMDYITSHRLSIVRQ